MKKTVTAVYALLCVVLLCACAVGQDGKADLDGAERDGAGNNVIASGETTLPTDGKMDNIQQEVTSDGGQAGNIQQEVVSDGGKTAGVQNSGTNKNGQDTLSAVQMQGLMQGNPGGIGSGLLAYTLPQQDGEDYKLCFFKEGGKVADFGKTMSEAVYYPLEMADYVFPDVRENNAPIGKFTEIYFFDTVVIGGDGATGLAVVAIYDVNGEACYDTRIYRWDGNGYSTEGKLMQEFNEKYHSIEEYPVEELYHLSAGTSGQSMQESKEVAASAQGMSSQPKETVAAVDDGYYSAATDLSRADVESYAARVRQLFLAHDWSAIASEISYPIIISDTTYNNSADFLNASGSFDSSLAEAFFSALEEEDCTEMFCDWEGIMIGETGQIWISEVLDTESASQGLKITAINGLFK